MRSILFFCLLFTLAACESNAATETDDTSNTEMATSSPTPAPVASSPTPTDILSTEASAAEAKPRPKVVRTETKADPDQAQPRPAVRPDVTLEQTAQQEMPNSKKAGGLNVTESPSTPTASEPVVEEEPMVRKPEKTRPAHDVWDALLRNNVSSTGQVNYRSLKGNLSTLDGYLQDLERFPPKDDWSKNEIMAYWINAYNAYTVKLILNNYPVQSIKDIDGGTPWATKWINIGDKSYSLNQIENDILRARYGDARIHFAVNCAAASCPPLHNRAFTAGNLNSTLQRLTRSFINNDNYNTLSSERIEVSKIFDWYAKDFGSVKDYINGYTDTVITTDTELEYKEYDWALNGR